MQFSCGIDSRARVSHLSVIDQHLARLVDQKVPNDLSRIISLLEPYQAALQMVVREHLQLVLACR